MDLHIHYESAEPYPLKWTENPEAPYSLVMDDKMRLSKDRRSIEYNRCLTLTGIPPETFDYRLGHRSALDWVIDQYRVKRDEKNQITSDPNRPEDPEYILRLVAQVITVSLETQRLVAQLPIAFSSPGEYTNASRCNETAGDTYPWIHQLTARFALPPSITSTAWPIATFTSLIVPAAGGMGSPALPSTS
jgi:hypothetical protein